MTSTHHTLPGPPSPTAPPTAPDAPPSADPHTEPSAADAPPSRSPHPEPSAPDTVPISTRGPVTGSLPPGASATAPSQAALGTLSPATAAPGALGAPSSEGPAAWPPALLPTDSPRRPGAVPWASAVVDGPLPDGVGEETARSALAALLYRCAGQGRVALAVADGEARYEVDGRSPLGGLAGVAADATGSAVVAFGWGDDPAPYGAPFELVLSARDGVARLRYDPALFERATAARLLSHYRTLLADALAHPDRPVSRLRLLTDAELRTTLVDWNDTAVELPARGTLHEAFEARADAAPDAVALVHGTTRLTYREVNAAANRLAHHLRSLGVGPDDRVGLCLDRSADLLVAELAVLKAGGAYVPLDPDYPAPRIATMVAGTSCAVMVSRTGLAANLPATEGTPLLLLDRDAAALGTRPAHNPERLAGPDHLCYIIHTSGSTGAPKPIALRHRGVLNNIADLNTRYGVGPGDAVLALSSPSFDMSVYEFLGLTAAGGTVVVPDAARTKDPAHWAELLAAEDVTVWNSAPALLGLLTDHLEQTGAGPLTRLRLALLGGDWVPVTLPERVAALAPGLRFVVMGGATESSIHSTLYEVEKADPEWTSIPYGRPMANQRVYILDDALQPVPPGVPGELYLAGVGLARGYLDQPERTAERFLEWSYGDVVRGERLYRTGDAARFGPDGMVELIGRRDFQVKIHGLRVELGEIESVLRSHPDVRQSVAVARDDRLVAYVVAEDAEQGGTVDTDALIDLAARRLPPYMVPAAVVALERLPLTPNGKLDRLGLPEPRFTAAAYRAPRTAAERVLTAVFAQVLRRERVGADDDFLALGGDSIRAIQVVTRARARGLEVTAPLVLKCRTAARLAERAAAGADFAADVPLSAPLADPGSAEFLAFREDYPGLSDVWPLTELQSGILFESELSDTGYDAYQMQNVLHLSGPVDPARMRAAGQALLDRYANLRVAFVPDAEDRLVQLVVDGVELPWREADFSGLPARHRERALRDLLAEDYADHFDRTRPPLLRMTLVRLGEERYELVLTTHHVLLDGWSEPILTQDLLRLYASGGDASGLPPVREFRDFLAWLERRDRDATARVWAEQLAGLDGPTLLVPGAPRVAARGAGERGVALTAAESRRLGRRAVELGVTVNTLVQGAWAVLLGGLTGRDDVVFGATVSGRPGALPGVESMVGLFINTLPVRVRCAPGDTLAELVTGLQSRQSELLDHHHQSLSDLHRLTGLDALFDTLVAFQSYPVDRAGLAEASAAAGVEVRGADAEGAAGYPLALIVETDPVLRLTLQYHRGVVAEETVSTVAARLHQVLGTLAEDPGQRVGAAGGVRGEAVAVRAEEAPPGETLPSLVEGWARRTPAAVAVTSEGAVLSYRELNTWANRLAHQLIRHGVGPDSVVALDVPRSVQLVVALVGVLKSGAAFVVAPPGGAPVPVAEFVRRSDVDELGARPSYPSDDADPGRRDRRVPLAAGHRAWLRRPSGTAGVAAVDHGTLAAGAERFASVAGLAPGTRLLAASPDDDAMLAEAVAALAAGAGVKVPTDIGSLGRDWGWTGDVLATSTPFLTDLLAHGGRALYAGTVTLTDTDTPPEVLVHRVRELIPEARVTGTLSLTTPPGARSNAPDLAVPYLAAPVPAASAAAGPTPDASASNVSAPAASASEVSAPGVSIPAASVSNVSTPAASGPDASTLVAAAPVASAPDVPALAVWSPDASTLVASAPDASALVASMPDVSAPNVSTSAAAGPAASAQNLSSPGGSAPAASTPTVSAPEASAPEVSASAVSAQALAAPDASAPGSALDALAPAVSAPDAPASTVSAPAATVPAASAPLRAPDGAAPGAPASAPTPSQEALCALVAEVLGVERVGPRDDFFGLGCNSLKATRIIGRMRRTLGVEVTIRQLFQHPNVADLSPHLRPAGAKSRPGLGGTLRRMAQRDGEGLAATTRQIRKDTKEQVTTVRENAKQDARQLKEQLVEQTREQYGAGFRTRLAEDVEERVRAGARYGTGTKGRDAKETQKLLKRMLDRFGDQVRDAGQDHVLTDDDLTKAQGLLTATADSLSALFRATPRKAG